MRINLSTVCITLQIIFMQSGQFIVDFEFEKHYLCYRCDLCDNRSLYADNVLKSCYPFFSFHSMVWKKVCLTTAGSVRRQFSLQIHTKFWKRWPKAKRQNRGGGSKNLTSLDKRLRDKEYKKRCSYTHRTNASLWWWVVQRRRFMLQLPGRVRPHILCIEAAWYLAWSARRPPPSPF